MQALRVGYAIAAPGTAAAARGPSGTGPDRITRRAHRGCGVASTRATTSDRRSQSASECARRCSPPATTLLPAAGNFVWLPSNDDLGAGLEAQGIIVRRFPQGIRVTLRRPARTTSSFVHSEPSRARRRAARRPSIRTSTETALRITLGLDGSGRSHVATGIGFLDHLLTLLSFHAGFDLDCIAGGDVDVDEHHTVEDVLAAFGGALQQALGNREGVARYGSAIVPMDEARATAAVDLVRRPHAEISLAFTGERVGGLALSLLPHALERFTMEAGCTVHVESSGLDDHHVAEAAFKALGQALRQAVAPGDGGIRSTKGIA